MGAALARALVLGCAAAAGCYSPSPVAELPCSDSEPRCPGGQFCDVNDPRGPTCQLEGVAEQLPARVGADAQGRGEVDGRELGHQWGSRTGDRRDMIPFGAPLARAEAWVRGEDGIEHTCCV